MIRNTRRNKKKKNSGLWILPAAVFVLLLAFGLRNFIGRPSLPSFPQATDRPSGQPEPKDIHQLLETLAQGGWAVRPLGSESDTIISYLIYIPFHYPLVRANLDISRLVISRGFKLSHSLENRKRQRLELSFHSKDSVRLSITILKRMVPDQSKEALPRVALALYFWPPDNPELASAFYQRPEIKTLITLTGGKIKDKEVLIALPMEPKGYPQTDPGPNTILVDDPAGKIRNKFNNVVKLNEEAVGFFIWHGSRAVEDSRVTDMLSEFCARAEIMIVEPYPSPNSHVKASIQRNGGSYLKPDLVIEPNASVINCISSLQHEFIQAGTRAGTLIILPATENSLKAVKKTLTKELMDKLDFVSVSRIAQ